MLITKKISSNPLLEYIYYHSSPPPLMNVDNVDLHASYKPSWGGGLVEYLTFVNYFLVGNK